ncbi:MAG: Bile acid:sodium symporter [Devosia sp.]|uniref:bile acid:sodium symporter family protein n=1 Tax=Devosia sp. TaxID=1871048 RepID=UPI0026309036|nr:bile acid:sodium symporter family protein [Devosia sp.]MDB5531115.1 Bile acid:sodium symporter [Devosia sp.]
MTVGQRLKRLGIDTYLLLILATVALAAVLPVSGQAADGVKWLSQIAVGLLFFLYGARLDTSSVIAGLVNWRLQLLVFLCTFVVFPLIALGETGLFSSWFDPNLVLGLLFVGVLPSTVQSSIAFVALARGNVAAAVCAASLSNLIGVVLTPVLCALLLHTNGGGINGGAVISIAVQILLPFVLGQLLRPWIGAWVKKHRMVSLIVDRGSILLIVYSAFSSGMIAGIWGQVDITTLALLVGCIAAMLAMVMVGSVAVGRAMGLSSADRTVLLYCGSTKSLASGVPMASILFAGQAISFIILPLMLFHQLQLIVCAILAQRQAALAGEADLLTAATVTT